MHGMINFSLMLFFWIANRRFKDEKALIECLYEQQYRALRNYIKLELKKEWNSPSR